MLVIGGCGWGCGWDGVASGRTDRIEMKGAGKPFGWGGGEVWLCSLGGSKRTVGWRMLRDGRRGVG